MVHDETFSYREVVDDNTTVFRFGDVTRRLLEAASREAFYADPHNNTAVRDTITAGVPRGGVLSYDVFDTLVWRDTISEIRRFREIAGRVCDQLAVDHLTPEDVLLARLEATEVSYRTSPLVDGCREGRLEHIYQLQMKSLRQPGRMAEAGVAVELAYETERLTLNETLMDLAREHVANGGRAVLLSDMYMEGRHIERLLAGLGVDLSVFEAVISSADVSVSKHCDGRAFPYLTERLNISADKCFHVGDSLKSDYIKALRRGWRALHLPVTRTERRQILADHNATLAALAERGLDARGRVAQPK